MKYIIILSLIVASCGTDSGSSGDSSSPETKSIETKSENKSQAKTSAVDVSDALYIATDSDLPECTDKNTKQLVYVEDSRVFKHCSKGEWKIAEIVVKDGKDGLAGKDGSNGKDGTNGVNGTNGKDGTTVNGNMWYDPVTKKYWLIPSVATCFFSSCGFTEPTYCQGDYRLPYQDELQLAVGRGLKSAADALGAPKEGWVTQRDASDSGAFQTVGNGVVIGERYVRDNAVTAQTGDNIAGQYCIQK